MAYSFLVTGNFKKEAIINSAGLKKEGGFKMKTKTNIKAGQIPPWVTNFMS
jgi:hypothetical protein